MNCGQLCVAPDYVLVDPSCETAFVESYIKTVHKFFPNGTQDPDNYARIINERHFNRIVGMLERSKGKIVFGGQSDPKDKWIEPTIIKVDSLDDSLLAEEIFGPLLPYIVVPGGLQEMLGIVRKLGDCPLALYAFTHDKKQQEMGMLRGSWVVECCVVLLTHPICSSVQYSQRWRNLQRHDLPCGDSQRPIRGSRREWKWGLQR